MLKKISKDIVIILLILSFLLLIFEIFSFYKFSKINYNLKLKQEYLPLIKHSRISKSELENHILNIKTLDIKNNGLREYHPNLIYLYKPNLKSETFYTNSLGLIDDELDKSKNQILLLGSSVAGGGMRQNFKENIDGYIENNIEEKIGKNIYEVLNAGIGGYASTQELTLMHLLISKISFEKIIYFSGANDISARYRVKDFEDLRSYDLIHSRIIKSQIEDNLKLRKNPAISMYTYLRNYFLKSLNSYKYLSHIFYEKRVRKVNTLTKEKLTKDDYIFIDEIVKNYISNVEKMISLTKHKNIELYVGIQPSLIFKNYKTKSEEKNLDIVLNKYGNKFKIYYEEAYPKMKKGLEILKKNNPNDIIILNTDDIFQDVKIDIYRDNVHFLEYANKIVAKKIFESLKFNK